MTNTKRKLEYLRQEIEQERISTGEILELESLAEHIDPSDTLLLEWAGVCEHCNKQNCECDDELNECRKCNKNSYTECNCHDYQLTN